MFIRQITFFPSPLREQSIACRQDILVILPSVAPAASHERDQHNQDARVDDRYHERSNLRLLLRCLSTSRTVSELVHACGRDQSDADG
jgi:hypothetical protein